MLFSLIIPTYNNKAELLSCLETLHQQRCRDFEVWVCVDGSTDGSADALAQRSWGFPCQVLKHADGKNHGRAAARNLALGHLTGQYLLLLDSDMLAAPDLLDAHLEVLKQGNTISVGAVTYTNVRNNVWVRYLSERGIAKFEQGASAPFNYFITPNTALPAEWFTHLKGFDEAISGYGGEDMELGYRLHTHFKPDFICNKKAQVFTTQEKQLEEALIQLREYGRTGLRYITDRWPELKRIYWVNRIHSRRLADRLLAFLLKPFFRSLVKGVMRVSPYFIRRICISYLVVANVHEGYRAGV